MTQGKEALTAKKVLGYWLMGFEKEMFEYN